MQRRRIEETKQFCYVLPVALGARIAKEADEHFGIYPGHVVERRLMHSLATSASLPTPTGELTDE